jgi:hypothetical protein
MGLDVTVYLNPTPATPWEVAALRADQDRDAALVALDHLLNTGAFGKASAYEVEVVMEIQRALMTGGPLPDDWSLYLREAIGLIVPYVGDFPARAVDLGPAYRPTERWDFAMGYGWFNRWRERLALLVGITWLHEWWDQAHALEASGREPTEPFWQLINFSDCEGALGPSVCTRLATDFDAWADRASAIVYSPGIDGASWSRSYETWRKAMHDAARTGGLIEFH